jgi:hypothetical protein
MSGKKTRKMAKKKLKTWSSYTPEAGEVNEEKSLTMPDMQNDPRVVLENHVRGINPITGAILDNQRYYGDAILPYAKDLTFEELRIQRVALETKLADLNEKIQAANVAKSSQSDNGLEGNVSTGETTNS